MQVSSGDNKGKHPHTSGERLFNFTSWFGLGWIGNAIVSLYTTDAAKHTWLRSTHLRLSNAATNAFSGKASSTETLQRARRLNEKLMNDYYPEHAGNGLKNMYEKIGTPDMETLSKLKEQGILPNEYRQLEEEFTKLAEIGRSYHTAESNVTFLMLNVGGWAMMAPIKWMEDHKGWWVRKFDEMLGSKNAPAAQKEQIEARYKEIEQQPKQTWGSVLASRAISQPIIIGIYNITSKQHNFLSAMGFKGFKGMDKYSEEFGKYVTNKTSAETLEKAGERLGKAPFKTASKYEKFAEDLRTERGNEGPSSRELIAQEIAEPKTDLKMGGLTDTQTSKQMGKNRFTKLFEFSAAETLYSLTMAVITFSWSRITGPLLASRTDRDADHHAPPTEHIVTPKAAPKSSRHTVASMHYENRVDQTDRGAHIQQ